MSGAELSVVLAGGGTAGHVSPMLAIADAVARRWPDAKILTVGTASGMETTLVPAAGYELATIPRVPLPRRPSADVLKLPGRLRTAIAASERILRDAGASVLVGVGGYVSAPMYIAARRLKVPVVIHEANAKPGLANRLGARWAAAVAVAFDNTRLPGAQWVGMPMNPAIAYLERSRHRSAARTALGLDPDKPTLVITGGSSGAASINRTAAGSQDVFASVDVQVLHITGRGKQNFDADGALVQNQHYRQVEYVDGMQNAYAAADLLVARAGAATVCEVSAVGLPSILVPLPHGNGEQALNAAGVVAAGGAELVPDAEFTPEWASTRLPRLFWDESTLARMSEAAESMGIKDAAEQMARLVAQVAGVR
ncbi:undecaprenyldiphospho-muramoylpentapeptide beta-N-acetylglucosaminyltransferase [Arthrobacter castelli]|uniref:undecaprenyldiphospho-muramoylpentapeptide beta-N-acetylglucosaminyltransferase n=1 Tax=Arthrobacter castelli TaxID=271431 RepID=UPI000421A4BA|nr:undecaprenyldiphospho-muramoylpentapeptide beta-N-acetylglucosaminyltransferase [Arthrobacter castelli]